MTTATGRPSAPSTTTSTRTRPINQPLAHRLLFPSSSPPSLFANPAIPPELTAEFYDFIALSLRAFVIPWWSKLSRYDKEFLPEITRILITVIRALEARVNAIDVPLLIFHHVPTIITQHYRDYRNAQDKLSTSYASGGAASLPQLFHQLQPHMAVSSDGRIDTEYFSQLVDHILKVCLPDEDYQPDAERFIVREIILKVLLNDVIPKLTQPWFIQKTILDLLKLQDEPLEPLTSPLPSSTFSFHALIVLLLSAVQSISGACLALIHAYKQAVGTIKRVNKAQPRLESHVHPMSRDPSTASTATTTSTSTSATSSPSPQIQIPQGDYVSPPLVMLSEIFTFHHRIASTVLLTTTTLLATIFSPFLDRLLPHLLTTFLSPTFILTTVRTAKHTLFPNGYLGPPPIEPSLEEQAEIHARLIAWRPRGALGHLVPFILGPDPPETLNRALDPLSSAPCNVHLILFLLDCIIAALFPELVGSGPEV